MLNIKPRFCHPWQNKKENKLEQIPFPEKKYNIIYADPPWRYSKGVHQDYRKSHGGKDRLLESEYPTMTKKELLNLDVKRIANDDCALFMWFTYSHLEKALELCKAWGFKYKTIAFLWLKRSNKGKVLCNVGAWTLGSTEACLIATRGNMLQHKECNNIRQLVDPNTDIRLKGKSHSRKPKEVAERIDLLFPNTEKIELFARQKTEGWDVWGNEV